MRKLTLNRETVRSLDNADLVGVNGGILYSLKYLCGQPVERPTEGIVVTCQGYTGGTQCNITDSCYTLTGC